MSGGASSARFSPTSGLCLSTRFTEFDEQLMRDIGCCALGVQTCTKLPRFEGPVFDVPLVQTMLERYRQMGDRLRTVDSNDLDDFPGYFQWNLDSPTTYKCIFTDRLLPLPYDAAFMGRASDRKILDKHTLDARLVSASLSSHIPLKARTETVCSGVLPESDLQTWDVHDFGHGVGGGLNTDKKGPTCDLIAAAPPAMPAQFLQSAEALLASPALAAALQKLAAGGGSCGEAATAPPKRAATSPGMQMEPLES